MHMDHAKNKQNTDQRPSTRGGVDDNKSVNEQLQRLNNAVFGEKDYEGVKKKGLIERVKDLETGIMQKIAMGVMYNKSIQTLITILLGVITVVITSIGFALGVFN